MKGMGRETDAGNKERDNMSDTEGDTHGETCRHRHLRDDLSAMGVHRAKFEVKLLLAEKFWAKSSAKL